MRDAGDEIDTVQEQIDLGVAEGERALLRGDEAVFHRVRHAYGGVDADDACGAFERVRGAHQRLEMAGGGGIAFESEQTGSERLGLRFRFDAKEIDHGEGAEIRRGRRVHERLLLRE